MPILTLHLLRLGPFITVPDFVQQLQTHRTVEVLLASRPRYKIIRPTALDKAVLSQHHDLVVLVRRDSQFWPSDIQGSIMRDYRLDVGVPGAMLASYPQRNGELLAGAREAAASLTGALDGALEKRGNGTAGAGAGAGGKAELDEGLLKFMERLTATYGDRPVTMLNLLRFHEGKKEDYQRYGQVRKHALTCTTPSSPLVALLTSRDHRTGLRAHSRQAWRQRQARRPCRRAAGGLGGRELVRGRGVGWRVGRDQPRALSQVCCDFCGLSVADARADWARQHPCLLRHARRRRLPGD